MSKGDPVDLAALAREELRLADAYGWSSDEHRTAKQRLIDAECREAAQTGAEYAVGHDFGVIWDPDGGWPYLIQAPRRALLIAPSRLTLDPDPRMVIFE